MEYVCVLLLPILMAAILTGCAVWVRGKGTKGNVSYLLVLGCKVNGEQPGKLLRNRIDAACRYLKDHPKVICIVSGYQSGRGQISEAACMQRELVAMGIEEERIWLEPKASTTKENLQFAMELINEKTGEKPPILGVLSSEHHLLRAQLLAARQNIACVMIPAKTDHAVTFIVNFLREIPLIWYYSIFK